MSLKFFENPTLFKYLGGFLGSIFIIRYFCNGPKTKESKDMKDKIVVVTGCSAGIGKETARDLLNKGAKVIFACRDKTKTLKVMDQITNESTKNNAIFMQLNLTSFKSVGEFVNEFSKKFDKLDMLVNNAGLINDKLILTEDNLENTLQTNHISHFALTGLLLKFLKKSDDPRIINLSSEAHTFTNNILDNYPLTESTYKDIRVYAASKAANIFFSEGIKEFCENRKDGISNICSAAVHPGVVLTEFMRTEGKSFLTKTLIWIIKPLFGIFFKNERMGAQTTLHCAYIDRKKFVNGGYYLDCKEYRKHGIIRKYDMEKKIHKMTYEAVASNKIFEENKSDNDFVDFMEFFRKKF